VQLSRHVLATLAMLPLAPTVAPHAAATPINYRFSVTATSGPLDGTTAAGSFTYDPSSIVAGGSNTSASLLTALSFTWDGITYDQGTANTGFLVFDASGALVEETFGNNCQPGSCGVQNGTEQWSFGFPGGFAYAVAGTPGIFSGTVTQTLAGAVPEPSALALFATGIAGLALAGIGRRRCLE
jgi:hypothetical protein